MICSRRRIDADEALALALAGKTFSAWRGSPLGQALRSALEKIAPIVGGAVSLPVDALNDLLFAPDDAAADAEHRHKLARQNGVMSESGGKRDEAHIFLRCICSASAHFQTKCQKSGTDREF